MGSAGEKRKGRAHLPKAGTRPDVERQLHARREEALHPFEADPWKRRRGVRYGLVAVIVTLVVLVGILALLAST